MLTALATACTSALPPTTPPPVPGGKPGHVLGYLKASEIPDSRTFLPPPPSPDSAAFNADATTYRDTRTLRNTPRWTLAKQDANLNFPEAANTFSCALGLPISATNTPHLNAILSRLRADIALTTAKTKDHYKRQRPYLYYGEISCTPEEKHKNDSYPSSHAAIGWAWALVLAEIAPQRGDALFKRGIAFGDSRVICGVHWQSDVNAGRQIGAAAIARLHANDTFTTQMALARKEIERTQTASTSASPDCAAETSALDAKPAKP